MTAGRRGAASPGRTRANENARGRAGVAGKIEGGDWASSVPAWCSFDVRTGIYPGEDASTRARAIEDFLQREAGKHPFLSNNPPEVEFNGFLTEGYELQPGSDAEALLATVHESIMQTALP